MNKQFILLILFAILLNACAPTATQNVTVTSQATVTSTSAPILTPTITVTATETPDPNKPPDAIGKDVQGNYTKVENGLTWTWHSEFNEWMQEITDTNGVPLAVYTSQALNNGLTDQIRLHVSIADEIPGAARAGLIRFNDAVRDDTNPADFRSVILYDIQMALKKRMGSTYVGMQQIFSGQLFFSFTTSEGSQNWKLGPNTTVIVDILSKPVGSGFQTWTEASVGKPKVQIQSRLFTDADGNLHVWIVPGTSLDQMTKEQLARIVLFGPASVISSVDQTSQGESNELETLVAFATDPARNPSIIFGPP